MIKTTQWPRLVLVALFVSGLLLSTSVGFSGCGGGSGSSTTPDPDPGPGPGPDPDPDPDPPPPDPDDTPTATNHKILVGPGFTDVSPHQIVRTTGNVLYAVIPTCFSYFPNCGDNALRVYKAREAGTPSGFDEKEAGRAPGGLIGSNAIGIDGNDRIHVLWNDGGGHVRYAIFDTKTDTWGDAEVVDDNGWTDFRQGDEGTALSLDASGAPHAVWTVRGDDGRLHLRYANRTGGSWHQRRDVDDVVDCDPPSNGCNTWHPTTAFMADGTFVLSWQNGTSNGYSQDGTIRVRRRSPGGDWADSVKIDDKAQSSLDNGPSMIVTANGVIHITFCDRGNKIRYWYDDGRGFRGDRQPPDQVTHNPSLGPDRDGGVFIYGHGTPDGDISGHGDDMYFFHKEKGATSWGPWTRYAEGAIDSSVTTRWSQFFHFHPEQVDIAYWADAYPNVTFVGVN